MNQLIKYVIALTNLYGLVHKNRVKDIYNSQNEAQVTIQEIEELLMNPPKELGEAFVYAHKEYFVHEAVLINDEFDMLLNRKENIPYYVPKEHELLKYIDETYYEETKAHKKLLKYVKKNFFKGEEEKAEWLCEEIQDLSKLGLSVQSMLNSFNEYNVKFEDIDQANEVLQLVMKVSNNTRRWENNGYSPQELFEKNGKPNLKPLPDNPFINNGDSETFVKENKVGRNDPCPCGSGKKYKKCCLKGE